MGTIIKYHNSLNDLSFTGFTAQDFNLFFAICSKVQGKDTQQVEFTYSELRKIAGIEKNYTPEEFSKRLARMNKKLLHLDYTFVDGNVETDFIFFPTFKRDSEEQTLQVTINSEGAYLLNKLAKNFTLIELKQFVQLESKYAKTLYRLLKQFKGTGELRVKVDRFREVLDIPESYTNKRITDNVIKPTIAALKPYFPHLECEAQHAMKRGRPVVAYLFKFDAEHPIEKQMQLSDYQKEKQKGSRQKKPGFNDFQQNEYDFDDLEQKLLGD